MESGLPKGRKCSLVDKSFAGEAKYISILWEITLARIERERTTSVPNIREIYGTGEVMAQGAIKSMP